MESEHCCEDSIKCSVNGADLFTLRLGHQGALGFKVGGRRVYAGVRPRSLTPGRLGIFSPTSELCWAGPLSGMPPFPPSSRSHPPGPSWKPPCSNTRPDPTPWVVPSRVATHVLWVLFSPNYIGLENRDQMPCVFHELIELQRLLSTLSAACVPGARDSLRF